MEERRTQERRRHSVKAYLKESFLKSADGRPLRILSEYLEPKSRFDYHQVDDTIVFMGSARLKSREEAEAALQAAERGEGDLARARQLLKMARYVITRMRANWLVGSPTGRSSSRTRAGASWCAPEAGRASWRRPTAAPPRPKA